MYVFKITKTHYKNVVKGNTHSYMFTQSFILNGIR